MAFTGLVARDGFNRANTGDINGSAADGDGDATVAVGTWAQHPAEPFPIGIDASDAVSKNTNYSVYTLSGTGVDEVQHGSETVLYFPTLDVPGVFVACDCAPAGEGYYHGPGNPETYLSPDVPNLEIWRLWFERPAAGTIITIAATFAPAIAWKIYYEVQLDGTTVKIYEDYSGDGSFGPYTHRLIQTFTARATCDFIQFDAGTAGNAIGAAWGGVGGGIVRGSTVAQSGVPAVTVSAPGVTLNHTDPTRNCGTVASGENGYTEVLVRCDGTVEDNYALGAVYLHAPATGTPQVTLQLWAAVGGSYTLMHEHTPFPVYHDTPQAMRLEITSANVLTAYWAGAVIFTFDLATDLADDTAALAPVIASGRPGMTFIQPDPTHVRIQQFSVYGGGDYPCLGPPTNPYPYLPPPITGPRQFGIWVRKNNAWRQVPIEDIHPRARRTFHDTDQLRPPMVRARNAWRIVVEDTDSVTLPEPETVLPPFIDPCELLPPIDPGPDVALLPITDRFFGISNSPTTVLGPLFTATKRSTGAWTPMEIGQVAARSSVLMGAQGGYGKFLLNGRFNREYFVDVTLGLFSGGVLAACQAATAAGTFFGHSFIDDFDAPNLWPPSGVSDADMVWMAGQFHAQLPGIRIGLRGRPTQFGFDPEIDFYGCQYVSWKHGDATAFGAREYNLARSRGSLITLDLNYIAGGNGSSGIRWFSNPKWYAMSPAEVVSYGEGVIDGAQSVDGNAGFLAGMLGYQWDPLFVAIPGMTAALGTVRNRLAQLPPP